MCRWRTCTESIRNNKVYFNMILWLIEKDAIRTYFLKKEKDYLNYIFIDCRVYNEISTLKLNQPQNT